MVRINEDRIDNGRRSNERYVYLRSYRCDAGGRDNLDGRIGVSAGAVLGCNYKSEQIGRAYRYTRQYCKDYRYGSMKSFRKTGNAYDVDFCYHEIPEKLDVF